MGEAKKGIGKLKIGLVISVIVIVVSAGLNIWFYMNKQSLELQIDDLWDNYGSEQWWHSYYQNMSDQLSAQKANLQNQVSNLTSEKNTLQEQVNALTTQRDNLQNQVNTLTSQVTSLQAQCDTLNASYYEVLANISSLQTQYDTLNASFYHALADIASLQTDLANMTNWKNSLQAQVTVLQDQIDNLNTQIAEKNATIANLQAQIADLEGQIDELNTTIAQKDAIIAEKNATIADLETRIDELEQMVKYEVYVLEDREYYYDALDLIQKSNTTIHVVMYYMKYDLAHPVDPANDLIRALVDAVNRNVNVSVILENEVSDNAVTYEYLIANNVNVTYDPIDVRTHVKLVVIDGYIVLLGSHNWTESGLWYNHEVSLSIKSEDIANILITYFDDLWT